MEEKASGAGHGAQTTSLPGALGEPDTGRPSSQHPQVPGEPPKPESGAPSPEDAIIAEKTPYNETTNPRDSRTTDGSALQSIENVASHQNDLSLPPVTAVDLRFRHVSVNVDTSPSAAAAFLAGAFKKGKKKSARDEENAEPPKLIQTILNDVSADMPSGSLTAIIGGSGSGKTSLLNVLAKRMHGKRLDVSGTISFNGKSHLTASQQAYVMQQDILLPSLTVRETLRYAADLRLPASMSREERHRVVEEVIVELGLKEAANTRIGNNVHKGCSGGEKRRVSVGVQLLRNPPVLFLDEPTTGLDATSAYQLVKTLKHLAAKGRTIITTIHQPRSEIWSLFNNIVLLTKGSTVYSGTTAQCLPYFASLGYELPAFVNPAEFVIDLAAIDTRTPELEAASSARVNSILQAWRTHEANVIGKEVTLTVTEVESKDNKARLSAFGTALGRQIHVLTARTLKVTWRDPMGLFGSLFEAIMMALITGLIFLQLDGSLAGIRSRQGALYNAAALQGYLILLYELFRLTVDIQLFDRERGEGIVGVPGFLISRRIARLFLEDIPVPLIFSIIYYFMAGFRADGATFLTFFAVVLLQHYIAITLATVCVAVSRHFAGASLIANLAYTLQSFACGYFIQANTIPVYVQWTKWVAYLYYAFGALCDNEFRGRFYDCPEPGGLSNPACIAYSGDFILDTLGFPNNWITTPMLALMGFAVAFYIGAGFILQFWRVEMKISRARVSETDNSAGKEKMTARSNEEVRTVNIYLDQYTLDIDKRKWWGKKEGTKNILRPVSAEFQPGVLNVIMGPSGSGKTSLLNSMARRLHSDFTTKYRSSGTMLFNGAVPSESVVQSTCAYVTQDDDALLSSLTVRETLRFAAGLRLPSWMTKEEKLQRAESVLLKMGLKDCADNLIGSELVKGISGGEKRRVTIAVQILTEPRVLLLDEPTSGLDAFTASSIIEVLRGLAEEGRTIILTIHQSRSDLYPSFGNVLLLARGGSPVYAGPGNQMLSHFSKLGFDCPRTTNPADFALDLITVDLQHEAKEAASREKVRSLIESWNVARPPRPTTTQIATPAELGQLKRDMASFHSAFPLLLHRAMLNFWRQPPLMIARIMQVFGLAIVLALFFAPLGTDYYSIQNRLGLVQEIGPIYFVGMLQNIAVYPDEKGVFYREHDDRAYGVEAFMLQYTCLEVPFEIVTSLLFAVLADLAIGLPRTPRVFFLVAYNCFCIVSCGESLGIMFNTLFDHTEFAVNVTAVFLSVAQIMGGIMSLDIPAFLQAFNHLSPVKWSVGNLAPYTLRGLTFSCPEELERQGGGCPIRTGDEALRLYKLDTNPALYALALGICAVVYRVLAYGVLKVKRERWLVKVFRRRG